MIFFNKGTDSSVIEKAKTDIIEAGGVIGHLYEKLNGFSASVSNLTLSLLVSHPDVNFIEADGSVSAFAESLGISKKC